MKKLVALFALLLLTAIVWAQNPKLSYQAVVRDNSNKLVTNDLVQVDIGVLKADNTPQYSQHFANVQTNQNGLFSLLFGGETGWDDVSWINARIGVRITLPDGSSVTDTTDVTAVPLAINTMFSHEVDPSSIAQSDWTQTDTDDPSYIKNKPNIPAIIATYIDTSAYFDQSVANNITNYLDTTSAVPSTEDLEALANRVDLFNTNVCDSVRDCVNALISDTAQTLRSMIRTAGGDVGSLALRVDLFNTNVCDSVAGCLEGSTTLQNAINNFLDSSSVYQNNLTTDIQNYMSDNHFLTSDSAVITTMQTGISTNTSNIADLQSALDSYAKLDGNNAFTGSNDFTGGTTKVASGFTFGTTTTETCNNIAVNACDLLNVFDSLYRRMSDIQENLQNQIDSLKGILDSSKTAPVILGVTGTPHSTSIDVAARVSLGGSPITSREFCYSTTSDIATATCVSATGNEKTLEGLTPNTEYYIWVKATNEIGTSTSEPVLVKTLPDTPTMSNEKVSASDDHVMVSADIDLKGADDAQLKLCYVETGTTDTTCLEPKTVTGTTFSEEIPGLDTNKTYTIVATLDNGADVPATLTVEATTLALKVTSDTSDTVKLCGDTLKVTYTATIANPDNYTYAWKVNGTDSASATGNTLMVNITTANSYKVTCVATNTADASVTATNSLTTTAQQGKIPSMVICADCDAGKAYVKRVSNVSSASWKLGGVEKYTHNTTGTYTIESGTYTVEVKSADGCAATYENITIVKQYTHCTVNTIRDNEMGSGTQLDSVKDHENNWYEVVQIGGQCWLKENMRATTSPSTGSTILMTMVSSSSSKSASYYNGDAATYGKYGVLYNWCAAVDTFYAAGGKPELANAAGHSSSTWYFALPTPRRGICPEGWHVPTDGEWNTLITSAGVGVVQGGTGAGKLAGGCDWSYSGSTTTPHSYAYGDRNCTGFYALPAGYYTGGFGTVNDFACFWSSSTPYGTAKPSYWNLQYNFGHVGHYHFDRSYGCSVRCLRD